MLGFLVLQTDGTILQSGGRRDGGEVVLQLRASCAHCLSCHRGQTGCILGVSCSGPHVGLSGTMVATGTDAVCWSETGEEGWLGIHTRL